MTNSVSSFVSLDNIELPSIEEIKNSQSPNSVTDNRVGSVAIDIMAGIVLPSFGEMQNSQSPNSVAYSRMSNVAIDPIFDLSNILEVKISLSDLQNWVLFSDPEFELEGISTTELQEIKNYVLKNYMFWGKPTHIIPSQSGLKRAIDVVDGKAYLLFNRKREMGDEKREGTTKIVSDAICLNDGSKHVSASISWKRQESCFNDVNEFQFDIIQELEKIEIFRGDSRFIQLVNFIEYMDKNECYKVRMIFPRFENDLLTALCQKDKYPFSDADKLDIAYQMIDFIRAAHEKGFILKDLKPNNILIRKEGDRWNIVCCDLEQFCEKGSQSGYEIRGTPLYKSPDLIATGEVTVASDIWALGITLAFTFDQYIDEITDKIVNGSSSIEEAIKNLKSDWIKEPSSDDKMKHLIWRMLQVDPKDRISSEDALKEIKLLNLHDQTY